MTKRRREEDLNGAPPEVAELETVFVDTSLDTHLAMLVCSSDTVSDFKKKVALEHMQCFPEIGVIEVHSVKVKRRSKFYHMPDTMLVQSAFYGIKRNWFLSVDASSINSCLSIRNSLELGTTSNGVKIGVTDINDDVRRVAYDANRNEILSLALLDGASENNVIPDVMANVEKPAGKTTDSHISIYLEEHNVGTESRPKKKRKVTHRKDACHKRSMMFDADGKDGKPTMPEPIVKASSLKNDENDGEGTSPPIMADKSNLESTMDSDSNKEDYSFKSMVDCGLGLDVPTQQGVVSAFVLDSTAKLFDSSGGGRVDTDRSKRKKKKVTKTTEKIQDTTYMVQIGEGERIKPSSENHKCDKLEGGEGLPLDHDREVIMSANTAAPGQVDPNLALKEASHLQDAEESTFSIVISEKLLDSNKRKEDNVLENNDVPTTHLGGVFTNTPDLSASGGTGTVNIDGKKRKKKKVPKTVVQVQDTRVVDHIEKGEMEKPHTETTDSEKRVQEKSLSLEHDNEDKLPSDSKAADHVDPDLAHAEALMEPESSTGNNKKKKRKREKNSVGTSIQNSGISEIHNGIGSLGLPSTSTDRIPKETEKEEIIWLDEGKDSEMKMLDGSNRDAQAKVSDANREEADLAIKTQNEQRLEDVSIINKKMVEKTTSSAADHHADFPTAETEIPITVSSQAEKDNENRNKKATKKSKKQKHTVTDLQENFPNKDQPVGIKPSATKETSVGFENSKQEVKHADSSQLVSRKTEQKVDEMHEIVVNTDNLAENRGEGTEDIKFKQYFVPGQLKEKVDSVHKVRKGTKLQKSSKKAKDNKLMSPKISTELQKPIKSFENQETGNNSYREDSGRTNFDATQNSDMDETSPNSVRRSSEGPQKEGKDSTLQKRNGIVTAPSAQKKNRSLDKSSSKRSNTLPNIRGNERPLLGLSLTNTSMMKTPKKKTLFAKSGTVFGDNSGESSGDENGIMHSKLSTFSLSDSSSMSDDSAGESEVSQNSTNKGCDDAEGKSTGQSNTSKLDVSSPKNLTMDLILRSSKRFKKAKEVASQTESQPIEFVPDTQPF